jgi:hypothetical protein
MLRRTWKHFKSEWLEKYPTIPAQNKGYKTLSVAVPIPVLREAVNRAALIQVNDQDMARAVAERKVFVAQLPLFAEAVTP